MREGTKFDEVAREFSEDKARQGACCLSPWPVPSGGERSGPGLWDDGGLNWTDCEIGGSLGWKPKGSLDPKFEEVAYDLETSSTGNPKYGEAKTGFGYHIIMVSLMSIPSLAASV